MWLWKSQVPSESTGRYLCIYCTCLSTPCPCVCCWQPPWPLSAFTFSISALWSWESYCCIQNFTCSYMFGSFTAGKHPCFILNKWKEFKSTKGLGWRETIFLKRVVEESRSSEEEDIKIWCFVGFFLIYKAILEAFYVLKQLPGWHLNWPIVVTGQNMKKSFHAR